MDSAIANGSEMTDHEIMSRFISSGEQDSSLEKVTFLRYGRGTILVRVSDVYNKKILSGSGVKKFFVTNRGQCSKRFDRRPVDPPPVIQLELLLQSDSSVDSNLLFESPCLFMCATLLPVHDGIASNFELETTIRSATGCMVSSLNHLKDLNDESGAFFVFPDISVRVDGVYRFRMTLFEITGDRVRCRNSINTEPFTVFPAKKFPGMEESTSLSRLFAEQGLKIRIRKELRSKRKKDTSHQSEDQEVRKSEIESVSSFNESRTYQGGDVRGENQQSFTSYPRSEIPNSSSQQPRSIPAPKTITLPRNILDTHARTNLPFSQTYASSTYSNPARPDTIIPEPSQFLDQSSSLESPQIPPNRSLPRLPSIERSKRSTL